MTVKGNHPLAEIIAKKLSGISQVPYLEQSKMISRACEAAVEWHTKRVNELKYVYEETLSRFICQKEN